MKTLLIPLLFIMVICLIVIFGTATKPTPQPDTRTTQQILDDRYRACIKNSYVEGVPKCKVIYD